MTHDDVEAVRRQISGFAEIATGDAAEAFTVEAFTADYELVTAPEMPDAGTYRGEKARVWLEAWVKSFDSLTVEPVEILDAGDKVFAEFVQRGAPRGGSTAVELRAWSVTTRRDGSTTRTELFMSRSQALEAAGLAV